MWWLLDADCGVYPRVCGGTFSTARTEGSAMGLSPRVRGNPQLRPVGRQSRGSIPACAGEPRSLASTLACHWVYPRVCGGTSSEAFLAYDSKGLSPRVRGNPGNTDMLKTLGGLYPRVCGGPRRAGAFAIQTRVYPRVCGGTTSTGFGLPGCVGLSPACAGEPRPPYMTASFKGVYPRVCGGTRYEAGAPLIVKGLSPRVRGNPDVE